MPKTTRKSRKKTASKKKRKTSRSRKKSLRTAKPEHYFILASGIPLKTIKELANALDTMHEGVFSHHVNEFKNDFIPWIKEVLDEKELAEDLEEIKEMKKMQHQILKYLVNKYL